jgi:hypothetical protein
MPGCNDQDKAKVRQERNTRTRYPLFSPGEDRQGMSLIRPGRRKARGGKASRVIKFLSGKPDVGKLTCPVWNGGKAVKPYLSLRVLDEAAGILVDEQDHGARSNAWLSTRHRWRIWLASAPVSQSLVSRLFSCANSAARAASSAVAAAVANC